METLQSDDLSTPMPASSGHCYGPGTVFSPVYGVSLDLPRGCLAGMAQGEIYGIQTQYNSNGRIYVFSQDMSLAIVKSTMVKGLVLGHLRLQAMSPLTLRNQRLSAFYKVIPSDLYTHAYVLNIPAKNPARLNFAVLSDESALQVFTKLALKLADSVKISNHLG